MTVISMAIDPDAGGRRWVQEFTWTLDLAPVLLEVLVDACLPQIPVGLGSRFDKDQINGGGYRDNMVILDQFMVGSGGAVVPTGAAADARELWEWLIGYTAAVDAWITAGRPKPFLSAKVNPDPLTARGEALVIVGWLIDHADQIAEVTELDDHRAEMFALIRRLRSRYGVFQHPRRASRGICTVCGEAAVRTWWATSHDGRARSMEVRTCSTCGDEHREDEGTAS